MWFERPVEFYNSHQGNGKHYGRVIIWRFWGIQGWKYKNSGEARCVDTRSFLSVSLRNSSWSKQILNKKKVELDDYLKAMRENVEDHWKSESVWQFATMMTFHHDTAAYHSKNQSPTPKNISFLDVPTTRVHRKRSLSYTPVSYIPNYCYPTKQFTPSFLWQEDRVSTKGKKKRKRTEDDKRKQREGKKKKILMIVEGMDSPLQSRRSQEDSFEDVRKTVCLTTRKQRTG